MADKQIALNITSAVAIGGKIVVPGSPEAEGVMVDEVLAKNLLQRGRAELSTAGGDDDDDKPLSEMTVPELKKLAAKYEIEGAAQMNKATLIEAIEKAEAE